jgi:hypothetical protein
MKRLAQIGMAIRSVAINLALAGLFSMLGLWVIGHMTKPIWLPYWNGETGRPKAVLPPESRRAKVEHVVFYSKPVFKPSLGVVVTGLKFKQASQALPHKQYCYFIVYRGGVGVKLDLAERNGGAPVEYSEFNNAQIQKIGVSRESLRALARSECSFREGLVSFWAMPAVLGKL